MKKAMLGVSLQRCFYLSSQVRLVELMLYKAIVTEAVVLYVLHMKRLLVLLVPTIGVCRVYMDTQDLRLYVGLRISVRLQPCLGGYWRGKELSIVAGLVPWASKDVLFLHHFSELTMLFVYGEEDATTAFSIWQELWEEAVAFSLDFEYKKLMMLSSFFLRLGQYVPFDKTLFLLETDKDISTLGVRMNAKKQHIKMWLRSCICSCAPDYALKTIHFLTTT